MACSHIWLQIPYPLSPWQRCRLGWPCLFPYWLLFSVFTAGALQYGRHAESSSRAAPLLAVAAVLIALLVGFRFEIGADWEAYKLIYYSVSHLEMDQVLELGDPGYMLFNWIAHQLNLGLWFVNFLCSLIFTLGLIIFAKRQPNPWLAVLVAIPYLVIVVAMGYSRQAVAIGIIMAGFPALEKQGLIRFGIYVLLAATFHKTAVMVLPLVALTSSRHRFVIGIAMAVMGYLLYGWFLQASVEQMVVNYIDAAYGSEGAAIRVAMNLVPAAIFLLFQRRFAADETTRKIWRNFSLAAFGTLVLLVVLASSTVVDRLALYIIPLQLFVFSRIPDAFPNPDGTRNSQLVLIVILYSALVQFVWLNYAAHADFWVPYKAYTALPSAG